MEESLGLTPVTPVVTKIKEPNLDEMLYTLLYAQVAKEITSKGFVYEMENMRLRYGQDITLVEADSKNAPRILKKLQEILMGFPEHTHLSSFVRGSAMYVVRFAELLEEYQHRLQEETLQHNGLDIQIKKDEKKNYVNH